MRLGFCALGIASAQADPALTARLGARPRPPFVRWEPEQRCTPGFWLKDARSVLAGAYPYSSRFPRPSQSHGSGRAYISPFAWAPDYHDLVLAKLEELGKYLIRLAPGTRYAVQADNGPGCERIFALNAGVGWQGKNNFIIVPGHGSFVWLGLLTTDLELPPDEPLASECGDCDLCLRACPTQAYNAPHDFDHTRCMAFWASDKQKLSPEQRKILGKYRIIYGCDFCQLACPHNPPGKAEEGMWPDLAQLLSMTKEEFEDYFAQTSAGWRGHDVLRRNAILAAAGKPEFRGVLEKLAQGQGKTARHAREALEDYTDV